MDLIHFISVYGVWLVAAFIALETVGFPFPAEAALMAAAIFAARTHELDISLLIAAGILAAILGNVAGFWIGRRFGSQLLLRYGNRVGLTAQRIRIGQWLFERYGGRFVFAARFLPFLRNMVAVLAGANRMPAHRFHLASGTAAVVWVLVYGLGTYHLGAAFADLAAPAAVVLGAAAAVILFGVPALIVRYEKRLLAKIDAEGSGAFSSEGLPRA
ncbi:MAG TPA: DedA family protein [Xanthobacteraceae bacterium]|nr:DedA family protein [Xanthobacteraceae bacterium]